MESVAMTTVVLHSKNECPALSALTAWLEQSASLYQVVKVSDAASLSAAFSGPRSATVLVLNIREVGELERVLDMVDVLGGVDMALLLPTGGHELRRRAYELKPRVVLSDGVSPSDLGAVVARMAEREESRYRSISI